MRRGGGKQKGASWEREVCRRLSLWISNGKNEDVYWRSAMSGGRSTVAHAKGKRLAAQAGDISCIDPIGHIFTDKFLCECKHYANLDLQGLLSNTGKLCQFWAETKVQARRYGKKPFLIAKQNRLPPMICLGAGGLAMLARNHILPITLSAPKLNLYIVLADDFFQLPSLSTT